MRPTTKRLTTACGLYLGIQLPGAVVSVVYGLPGDFVLPGEEPAKPDEVLGAILGGHGAALVAPPAPLIALVVFVLLARSRRWWSAIGTVGICLLSPFVAFAMFMESVTGRVFPPSASEIPVAVMVALFFVVPLLMFFYGVLDLIDGARTRKGERGSTAQGSRPARDLAR